MVRQIVSSIIYVLSAAIGIVVFFYPFFVPQLPSSATQNAAAPVITVVLLGLCLIVLLLELQGAQVNAKIVATLGVLIAITSVLRYLEVAIPGPGGFSPIFAPIILAGYVFGGRFGFLMGALTMLVSSLVTGTVGPWLPYQMFAAGWIGLTAGWLPQFDNPQINLLIVACFGLLWGVLYGIMLNLYFWPFMTGDAQAHYEVGLGIGAIVQRYVVFYLGTSFLWDIIRGVGNVALILVLGVPTLRALIRFRERFGFEAVG